ncbi:hypothetical protein OGAPHI_004138 [Ogataea philodendri]|uniref:Uncharacterized protein n=1 Tax=Ogataea philodendri TaxID=1378263 RepID=A0A9P8P6P7_9ASCO|nr:uncharacterized protein OGAPHI_004138 [Ogataea philodendri]KAH3665949.1 hypothetical protein OGAPHI_004138 [Ogataea philodendri]
MRDDCHVSSLELYLGSTDWQDEIWRGGLLRNWERFTVKQLVLQEHNWVWVSNSGLHESFMVLGGKWGNHLQTWDRTVPCRVVLRVLGSNTGSCTIWTSEGDVTRLLTTRHVVGLGCRVDDLVNRLHGKVESHELTNWLETGQSGTDTETGETHLGNWSVDNSLWSELVKQSSRDFIGTVILSNFLTH